MKLIKLLVFVVLVVIIAGTAWFLGSDRRQPITHERAVERWPELVKNGFKGRPKEVARVFQECFRKGDCAWDYEALLATAHKVKYPNSKSVNYHWGWDLGHAGEGDAVFVVITDDYPPIITSAYIAETLR